MTGRAAHQLVGRWRIVEADLWKRDFIDLVGPAVLTIRDDGTGEIAFGAVQADLDIATPRLWSLSTGPASTMDEVTGTGSTELLEDGSLEIELEYHHGDEAILKAVRDSSSTAC